MLSSLTLIILGRACFLGSALNIPPIVPYSSDLIPNIDHTQAKPAATRRDDYTYSPGIGAHKVHTHAASWNEARLICEEENAYLAIINSIAESEVIVKLLEASQPHYDSFNTNYALIGFHDPNHNREFVTVDNQNLGKAGFARWVPGEPNNHEHPENCGSLYKGMLNDVSCFRRFAFVCELPDHNQVTPILTPPERVTSWIDESIDILERKSHTTTVMPTQSSTTVEPTAASTTTFEPSITTDSAMEKSDVRACFPVKDSVHYVDY